MVTKLEDRPPKKKGKIANDVAPLGLRSAMAPMPTTDTTYQKVSRKIFPQSLNPIPPKAKIPATRMGARRYEVTVDGQKHEVSLNEALNGYIRQATFHQRLEQLKETARSVETEYNQLQQGWAMWNKARLDYEEDVANMLPREPNWDQEFAADPRAAHAKQKVFQVIYGNLQKSQQQRAWREQQAAAEHDRRVEKYAVSGFDEVCHGSPQSDA